MVEEGSMRERRAKPLIFQSPALRRLLRRRAALLLLVEEFKDIDVQVKARFKKIPLAIVGEFEIRGQRISVRRYIVKGHSYWKTEIRTLPAKAQFREAVRTSQTLEKIGAGRL
jgi:hypothetical protein